MRLWSTLTWTAACLPIEIQTMRHKPILWDRMQCRPRKKRHYRWPYAPLSQLKKKVLKKKKTNAFCLLFSNRPESEAHAKKLNKIKNKNTSIRGAKERCSSCLAPPAGYSGRYLHQRRAVYWRRRATRVGCGWWMTQMEMAQLAFTGLPSNVLSALFWSHAQKYKMQKACMGRPLKSLPLHLRRPHGKTRWHCPLAQVASHWTLSVASNSACVRNKGTNEEMGMVEKLGCDHRASERVATRPSAFPSEKWRLWKRLIQTPIAFCPRRSSQLNHFSPTCSICSLTKMQNQQRTEKQTWK